MNIARTCISRPIMTTLVMFAILLFGGLAYRALPISNLPNVDFPTIMVSAYFPGASADTMAKAVANPLEKQFSAIAGLNQLTSTSTMGQTQITLQFDTQRNLDGAALDVQAAITAASAQLPQDMPTAPTFAKVNPASQPVIYLTVSSNTIPLNEVDYFAETIIGQRLSRLAGVAQVQINGSQVYAVRVQLNPQKLSAYNLSVNDVMTAVAEANQNQPTGTLWGKMQAFSIQTNGQLLDARGFRSIIVATHNDQPIRLGDVATVIDSVQNDKALATINQKPAVILAVLKQPGTNTIQLVDDVKKLLPKLQAMLPASVKVNVLYDQSVSIRDSVADVQFTLLLTVGLVVLVIFVFLGNLSATIIPSLALPVSIIGTFACMKLFGFSLNNLTLMALSLCVGFVVDDAIVMLENIVRHMEMGKPPVEAALDGASEIGFTIVSMTLSLVAVFIPVLLMPGIIGRLFNEFSITIAVAILISGFVSLTLTPMLCSRFLRQGHGGSSSTGLTRFTDLLFKSLLNFYRATLIGALRHKPVVVAGFVGMTVLTALLFVWVPQGFMPEEDTSQILIMTEAAQGISFEAMAQHHESLVSIILADPNVQTVMSSIGIGQGSPNITLNQGRILVVLKPRNQRHEGVKEIIHELSPKLAEVSGIKAFPQNPPAITIGGQVTQSLYQVSLSSPDPEVCYSTARSLLAKIRAIPGLTDVTSDLQVSNPEVHISVDRDKLSKLGLTMFQVEDTLNTAYSARQISTMYTSTNQYWVVMEVAPEFYRDPSVLHSFYLNSPKGGSVPLDTLATIELGVGPLTVNHLGQFSAVTISFNLSPGYSLGSAVSAIKRLASDTALVPESVTVSFQGMAQCFEDSFGNMSALLGIAVLVIYIVLGVLYESYIHPLTILSGLPSAGLGALAILLLCHVDLNIYGFLGLIMLIGIVKKNAIMMIDFALDLQRTKGLGADAAIYHACLSRFRPIMMTTMAALMGAIPIALGIGAGAEARQPLGLTVVGGLLVSQLVTLYITPVFYIYLDRIQRFVIGKSSSPKPVAGELLSKS